MPNFEEAVEDVINDDLHVADFRFSLFHAALASYRFDSVLRPYPQNLMDPKSKETDVVKLRSIAANVPHLTSLLDRKDFDETSVGSDIYQLLKWLYFGSGTPHLKTLHSTEMTRIQELTEQQAATQHPNYIFEVLYDTEQELRFQRKRNSRKILHGYHGSRIENFHSILHNGLHVHLNKNSVFGTGTYLSSELSVSMIYSPSGATWKNSALGSSLSCVAVCEIVDDPSVKRQINGSSDQSRSRASDTEAGDIPEKYYLVTNNDFLRVKYLLVYVNSNNNNNRKNKLNVKKSWFQENKFLLTMSFYVILLLSIGLSKSRIFQQYFIPS